MIIIKERPLPAFGGQGITIFVLFLGFLFLFIPARRRRQG
jgi:hypothetical protein